MSTNKRLFLIWILVTMLLIGFCSCGPSAEQQAATKKQIADSIENNKVTESSGQLKAVAPPAYIKCLANDYAGHVSNMDVYLIGTDTFIVVTNPQGGIQMLKK